MAAPMPPIATPVVDPKTGTMTVAWYEFLRDLWRRLGAGSDITLSAPDNETVTLTLKGTDSVQRTADVTVT